MWDVRGWKRLTIHDDPPLVNAREEFLSWLAEVPEPNRSAWEKRIKSKYDYVHLAVRLELYLHHYFKNNNWRVEIEPNMPGSPNKPDFKVLLRKSHFLVEAKTVFDEQDTNKQYQRLMQLADELTNKLSKLVIIEPLSDLPPSLPSRKISSRIEQRAELVTDKVLEFDFSDEHLKTPYALKFIILPRGHGSTERGEVGGTIPSVHTITTCNRVRNALEEKAGKYGCMDIPFIIAICWAGQFPIELIHEINALFGDTRWQVPLKGAGEVTEKRLHEDVSAVLFYRFKWVDGTHSHNIHIYHNPFALRPINAEWFCGVPQLVTTLKWINGEPDGGFGNFKPIQQ